MKLEQRSDGRQLLLAEGSERIAHLQNPKTNARPARPEAVVLHYTAVRAPSPPIGRLSEFRKLLGDDFASVEAFVQGEGKIPSALMLSLSNASKPERKASWDITVGKDGVVVQCNLKPSSLFTWHAGRSLQTYVKERGSRDLVDRRGTLVYDGSTKRFAAPRLPSGKVMDSGNPTTIGIEIENWGRVTKLNGVIGRRDGQTFKPIPGLTAADLVEVNGKLFERIPPVQYEALIGVCRALRDFYAIPISGWFGHHQIVPDRRADPEPPLDLDRMIDDVYADRLEVATIDENTDHEVAFVSAPLPDNDAG